MSRLFEVEAPAPFSKFEGQFRQSEQNRIAYEMHNTAGDVRQILNRKDLKRYERGQKTLKALLDKHGVNALMDEYKTLRDEIETLKSKRYDLLMKLKEIDENNESRKIKSQLAVIYENASAIKGDWSALKNRLNPYRRYVRLERRIASRIQEHHAGVMDEKIQHKNRKMLEKEAAAIGETFIRILNGQDFCYRTTVKGKTKIYSVMFDKVYVTPDTIQFKLKVTSTGLFGGSIVHVPQGVNLASVLKNENVLALLSSAIEMPVTCPQVESGHYYEGLWLFVNRAGMSDGLPARVGYGDYMKRYPSDQRDLLPVPAGLREGMWVTWVNLVEQPHLLITGQNGTGKTNSMISWISTLISQCSPRDVQIALIDLKEGADLSGFAGIPHLIGDVITDVKSVERVFVRLEQIRAERMREFQRAGVRNITAYNMRHPDYHMPHVFLFFDEFAALAANHNKESAKTIYSMASQLAMKARASGIHLILGVQTPRREHVPPDIKDNITFRLTGRMATLGASLSAIGSSEATNLPKLPGRNWCENGIDAYAVQMPYITDAEVEDSIRTANSYERVPTIDLLSDIAQGDGTEPSELVLQSKVKKLFNTQNFLDICIDHLDGVINYTQVFEIVKEDYDVSFRDLARIADNVKRVEMLEHRGKTYQVVAKGRGNVLVEVDLISISTPVGVPQSSD